MVPNQIGSEDGKGRETEAKVTKPWQDLGRAGGMGEESALKLGGMNFVRQMGKGKKKIGQV